MYTTAGDAFQKVEHYKTMIFWLIFNSLKLVLDMNMSFEEIIYSTFYSLMLKFS